MLTHHKDTVQHLLFHRMWCLQTFPSHTCSAGRAGARLPPPALAAAAALSFSANAISSACHSPNNTSETQATCV